MYVCALVCVCMCVCSQEQHQFRLGRNLLLFSLSHLLALLTAIVSPSSFTALPSERGHGEVLSALFWKCNNNNNDDDSFNDDYSNGEN